MVNKELYRLDLSNRSITGYLGLIDTKLYMSIDNFTTRIIVNNRNYSLKLTMMNYKLLL